MRFDLVRSYRVPVTDQRWRELLAFEVPGARMRALVTPEGGLAIDRSGDTVLHVPDGAKALTVHPELDRIAMTTKSRQLAVIDATGNTVCSRDLACLAVEYDRSGRLWVVEEPSAEEHFRLSLLDERLGSVASCSFEAYPPEGTWILIDPGGSLVAVSTAHGQDGSAVALMELCDGSLELLEYWTGEPFSVEGFGTSEHGPVLYAVFGRRITSLLCPDIALGAEFDLPEGEHTGWLARLWDGSLWLEASRDGGARLLRLDGESLGVIDSAALPEPADGAEVVASDLLMTYRLEINRSRPGYKGYDWSKDYFVSLWQIA